MIPARCFVVAVVALTGVAAEPARDLSFVAYPTSPEALVAEFPTVEANGTAKEVEKLSATLGIDVVPRWIDGRTKPAPEAKKAWDAVRSELETYVVRELEDIGSGAQIPPLTVDRYLSAHRETLDSLREMLIRSPHPRWDRNVQNFNDAGLPNLLGHMCLQKVLIVDALAQASAGDNAAALADLEASWALNTALRDEPAEITQLIAVSVARLQAGALRHVRGGGEAWVKRVREHDYRRSVLRALALDGWRWTQIPESPRKASDEPEGLLGRIARAAGKPYVRLCLDDAAERWKTFVESAATADSLCEADFAGMKRDLEASVPWWNREAPKLLPPGTGALERVARLELDLEMTTRILEIEAVRAKTGAWPRAVPRGERSSACPATSFVYLVEEDGTMSLSLDREPGWDPPSTTLVLPTRYVRSPREAVPKTGKRETSPS